MTILNFLGVVVCICVFAVCIMCAFAIGYTIAIEGSLSPKKAKPPPETSPEREEEFKKKSREYENFLKYDGSEQT